MIPEKGFREISNARWRLSSGTLGLGTNVLGLTGSATRCKNVFDRRDHGCKDQHVPTAELVDSDSETRRSPLVA